MIWTLLLQDNDCYVFGNSVVICRSVQLHNLPHTFCMYFSRYHVYAQHLYFIHLPIKSPLRKST